MNNTTALDQDRFNWLVCPATERWLTAIRRFASELTPQGCVMPVIPADPGVLMDLLTVQRGGIVFWTITSENLSDCCDTICRIAIAFPDVLQLASGGDLSDVDRAALGEIGVSVTIGHPEDVPKLAHMINVYFARLS